MIVFTVLAAVMLGSAIGAAIRCARTNRCAPGRGPARSRGAGRTAGPVPDPNLIDATSIAGIHPAGRRAGTAPGSDTPPPRRG